MKIGILSDTHDNIPYVEKAVAFFNAQQVRLVLHAGDYVAPWAVEPMKKLAASWVGVMGANDGDTRGLVRVSEGKIHHPPFTLSYQGRKILLTHQYPSAVDPSQYHLIVHGYTHQPAWQDHHGALVVNPGECCGWLRGKHTVALVEMESRFVRIVDLDAADASA